MDNVYCTFHQSERDSLSKKLKKELTALLNYKVEYLIDLGRELWTFINTKKNSKCVGGNLFVDTRDLSNFIISGNLWIDQSFQNKGLGQALIRAKCAWADELEFNLLMRVPKTSEKGIHILNKYNWQYIGREYWRYYHKTDQ